MKMVEFLMDCGRAILIILIVGGAMFALGVFNPDNWINHQKQFCENHGYNYTSSSFESYGICYKIDNDTYHSAKVKCIDNQCYWYTISVIMEGG